MLDRGTGIREVFDNPGMRRLLEAFALLSVSEWAFVTALSIQAYRVGGALAVGFVGFRFFPGAVSSAVLAPIVDGRPRVLTQIAGLRFGLLGLGAVCVLAGVALPIVLVITSIDAVVAAPYRPAQARLIPALARAPSEVSAAAAGVSMFKTIGRALGALLGGVLAALVVPGWVMAGAAGVMAGAALLTLGLDLRTTALARTISGLRAGWRRSPVYCEGPPLRS